MKKGRWVRAGGRVTRKIRESQTFSTGAPKNSQRTQSGSGLARGFLGAGPGDALLAPGRPPNARPPPQCLPPLLREKHAVWVPTQAAKGFSCSHRDGGSCPLQTARALTRE